MKCCELCKYFKKCDEGDGGLCTVPVPQWAREETVQPVYVGTNYGYNCESFEEIKENKEN